MVFRSGSFVEERLDIEGVGREYSKNLSIDTISRQRGDAVVGSDGVVRRERSELSRRTRHHYKQRAKEDADKLLREAGVDVDADEQFYRLNDDESYYVEFAEEVDVPDGHVGLVFPRENLLGAGVRLHSTYVGPGQDECEALLTIEERFVLVSAGAEIAELVVIEPEEA